MPSALVGNALYFGLLATKVLLKYDLELHKMSVIGLPFYSWRHVAVDGELGLAAVRGSKLCMWKKAGPKEDAGWTQQRAIELDTLLPSKAISISPFVVGCTDGGGVIFLVSGPALYRIDLKTSKATKVCMGRNIYSVVPYMSFYTPGPGTAFLALIFCFTIFGTNLFDRLNNYKFVNVEYCNMISNRVDYLTDN